jgi:hypothetical protein
LKCNYRLHRAEAIAQRFIQYQPVGFKQRDLVKKGIEFCGIGFNTGNGKNLSIEGNFKAVS